MKATKTIAAFCAISMAVSTIALPVQAKTYPTETEIITMDDAPTTTKTKATKPKSKTKTKTKATKATDEYKDFGKDLKITVHTPDELKQAYLYANMMCAKSLKITLAKDYKMSHSRIKSEFVMQEKVVKTGMMYGFNLRVGDGVYDNESRTITLKDFGNVMSYFTYAYRTGNTDIIPKEHKELYDRLAKGVDSCMSGADSVDAIAQNVYKWLRNNAVGTSGYTYAGDLKNSVMHYNANNKMLLNCGGHSCIFMTMMRMAGYTAYHVQGFSPNGIRHSWNAVKVGSEYKYYDAGWGSTDMTYKEMISAGYAPELWYLDSRGELEMKKSPTQKELEASFIDWRY